MTRFDALVLAEGTGLAVGQRVGLRNVNYLLVPRRTCAEAYLGVGISRESLPAAGDPTRFTDNR